MRYQSRTAQSRTARSRAALLLCADALLWPLAPLALAQDAEVRMLVQRSPLAGFRYYAAPALFEQLRPGEPLGLVREPDNPHDANAIRVDWRGHMLGYVPRRQNATLAWALDGGQSVEARIAERRRHPNPRRRVEFDVFIR